MISLSFILLEKTLRFNIIFFPMLGFALKWRAEAVGVTVTTAAAEETAAAMDGSPGAPDVEGKGKNFRGFCRSPFPF
jgi:hypothetical protein